MRPYVRFIACGSMTLAAGFARLPAAHGDVVQVQSHVETTVNELTAGTVIQTDKATLDLPGTASQPPLVVRGRLSRTDPAGPFVSGARGMVLFNGGLNAQLGQPNNVGLDIAAFSTSSKSGWSVDGLATERRTIVIKSGEVLLSDGAAILVNSTLYLSGVLFITSPDANQDLSGAVSRVEVRITQARPDQAPQDVLVGTAQLTGTAPTSVSSSVSGVISSLHGVVPLDGVVKEFPVLRTMLFFGALPIDQYAYGYTTAVGETFDLTLSVHATVTAPPGQVGCAAVFGVPQEGFADLYQKAKGSDAGVALQNAISSIVETTGADVATLPSQVTPVIPFAWPRFACGTLGFEALGLGLSFAAAALLVRGRRRGRGRRG